MSVDNKSEGVDNTKEAVKAVLSGDKLGEVATRLGVDKGTLSKLVKGAQIGQSLISVDNGSEHGVDNTPPPDCETCEKLQALTTEVETLRSTVENGEGDDSPPVVDHSEELMVLTTERDNLQDLVDNLQAELTTLRESQSASVSDSPPASGELPGVEFETVCYYWSDIADLKQWVESMGQDPENIVTRWAVWRAVYHAWQQDRKAYEDMRGHLVRMCRRYVEMRKHFQPGWKIPPLNKINYEVEAFVIANTDDDLPETAPAPNQKEAEPEREDKRKLTAEAVAKMTASVDALNVTVSENDSPAGESALAWLRRDSAGIPVTPELRKFYAEHPQDFLPRVPRLFDTTPAVEVRPVTVEADETEDYSFADAYTDASPWLKPVLLIGYPIAWLVDRLTHRN
jgi:hypothetical protein